MAKIKKIIDLSKDLTFGELKDIDSQLLDVLSDFDSPSVDDLLNFLADRTFAYIKTDGNDFYVLDLENMDLDAYDLTDPKNLLDHVENGFSIREFYSMMSQLKLEKLIRNTISDFVSGEFPDISIYGEVVINE